MNRTLVAAAFAAVLLPAGAFEAAAAPSPVTTFGKTYALQCQVNANDGVALKVRILVKNTTGRVIKKGTPITLRYTYRFGPGGRGVQRVKSQTQIAYRDVMVNDSIGLDQPQGAYRCSATVTLRPDLQTKIKTTR
jgi:hypothetical protein